MEWNMFKDGFKTIILVASGSLVLAAVFFLFLGLGGTREHDEKLEIGNVTEGRSRERESEDEIEVVNLDVGRILSDGDVKEYHDDGRLRSIYSVNSNDEIWTLNFYSINLFRDADLINETLEEYSEEGLLSGSGEIFYNVYENGSEDHLKWAERKGTFKDGNLNGEGVVFSFSKNGSVVVNFTGFFRDNILVRGYKRDSFSDETKFMNGSLD